MSAKLISIFQNQVQTYPLEATNLKVKPLNQGINVLVGSDGKATCLVQANFFYQSTSQPKTLASRNGLNFTGGMRMVIGYSMVSDDKLPIYLIEFSQENYKKETWAFTYNKSPEYIGEDLVSSEKLVFNNHEFVEVTFSALSNIDTSRVLAGLPTNGEFTASIDTTGIMNTYVSISGFQSDVLTFSYDSNDGMYTYPDNVVAISNQAASFNGFDQNDRVLMKVDDIQETVDELSNVIGSIADSMTQQFVSR